MAGPRTGDSWWVWLLALLFIYPAATLGKAVLSWCERQATFAAFPEPVRNEIASLRYTHAGTAALEQKWIDGGFASNIKHDWFLAPIAPGPCRRAADALQDHRQRENALFAFDALQTLDVEERIHALATIADRDPSNHLVGLMLARELTVNRSYRRAESAVVTALTASPAAEQILESAVNPAANFTFDNESLATVIHLYHTLGVTRLSTSGTAPPWNALKEVIACVLPLSRRAVLGPGGRGVTAEAKLAIPSPGCNLPAVDELSSYDLFNNLIIAYAGGNYSNPEKREKEFTRQEKVYPSAVRELFMGQLGRAAPSWEYESRLWALSNVDRVLDFGVPDDGRLALNIIGVVDWWSEPDHCPADLCTAELRNRLAGQRMELLRAAMNGRRVAFDQRAYFAATVIGMFVRTGVDRHDLQGQMRNFQSWLPPNLRGVAADLVASENGRNRLPRWIVSADGSQPPWLVINNGADAWRSAALNEFVLVIVPWALEHSAADREQTLVALNRLFSPQQPPPVVDALKPTSRARAAVVAARSSVPVWWSVSVMAASIVWLLLIWLALQVREYRLIRKSFFEIEREYIDALRPSKEP